MHKSRLAQLIKKSRIYAVLIAMEVEHFMKNSIVNGLFLLTDCWGYQLVNS